MGGRTVWRQRYGAWAVVAGASEGIGAAFAEALAARGLDVLLVARRPEPLERMAEGLRTRHAVTVRTLALDLAGAGAAAAIDQAAAGLQVGMLVYNAAFAPQGAFLDVPLAQHQRVLAVNCCTPAELVHRLGARMAGQGRGGIVLMSSLTGYQGSPNLAHYAATKAYNLVLAEGLWDELRGRGVDVLACAAGATRTPGYEASPQPRRWLAPPVLEPSAVVDEALRRLGRAPSVIPGAWNRLAGFLMHRLLSRRRAVITMGQSTRGLGARG